MWTQAPRVNLDTESGTLVFLSLSSLRETRACNVQIARDGTLERPRERRGEEGGDYEIIVESASSLTGSRPGD